MRILLLIFSLFLLHLSSKAQSLSLYFGDTLFVEPGSIINLDLKVDQFQRVGTFSFTLRWNSSQLALLDQRNGGLDEIIRNADPGQLRVVWVSGSGLGSSLVDGSVLLHLQFRVQSAIPQISTVDWAISPLPTEFFQFDGQDLVPMEVMTRPMTIVSRYCKFASELGTVHQICPNDSIELQLKQSAHFQQIKWNTGALTPNIWAKQSGKYTVQIQAPQQCTFTDSTEVILASPPNVDLGKDIVACEGDSVALGVRPQGATVYQWLGGPNAPGYSISKSGYYILRATRQGCTASDTVNVQFRLCDAPKIYLPTAFAPKGSGKNSKFRAFFPEDLVLTAYSLQIYDRWGSRLFVSQDYDEGWDGVVRGELAQQGSYYYVLALEYKNGGRVRAMVKKGEVVLLW